MKNTVLKFFILFIFIAFFTSCNTSRKSYLKNVFIYKDTTSSIQANQLENLNFKDLNSKSLGFENSVFWFKITLQKEVLNDEIYLQFKETFLKNLELYNESLETIYLSTNIKSSNLFIPLKRPTKTIYAKVEFKKNPFIIIDAHPISSLEQSKRIELLERGGFYMLIAILLIINMFLAYFFKSRIFLWYFLFELNLSIGIALYDNTINSIISNQNYITYLTASNYFITPIASILFCIYFLKVHEYYPKLVRFYKVLFIPLFIINCIFIYTEDYQILAYGELIGTVLYLSSWILGFVLIRKSNYALIYVLGYSVLFVFGILYSLSVNFGWTFLPLTINFLKVGVLVEILVLTFAVLLKAKKIIIEHSNMNVQLANFVNTIKHYENKESTNQKLSFENKLIELSNKYELTDRETDVLLQLSNGLTNQQIADTLFISVNTVKFHTRNLYEKLNIKKRTEITSKFLKKEEK